MALTGAAALSAGVLVAGMLKEGASSAFDGIKSWWTDAEGKEDRRQAQWSSVRTAFERCLDSDPNASAEENPFGGWYLTPALAEQELADPPNRLSLWMRVGTGGGGGGKTSMGQNELRILVEPLLQRMWNHTRTVLKQRGRSPLRVVVLEQREWLLKLTHMEMDARCVEAIKARVRFVDEIRRSSAFANNAELKEEENRTLRDERGVLKIMSEDLGTMRRRVETLRGDATMASLFRQLTVDLRISVTKAIEFVYFVLNDGGKYPRVFDVLELREATTKAERERSGDSRAPGNLFASSGFTDTAMGLVLRSLVRSPVMVRVLPSRVSHADYDEDSGAEVSSVGRRSTLGAAAENPAARIMSRRDALRHVHTDDRLVVWAESASGLTSADRNGLSDPFVTVSWLGDSDDPARGPVVKGSLDPVWDAQLSVPWRGAGRLVFEVYDWDKVKGFGGYTLLGRATVDVGGDGGQMRRTLDLPLFNAAAASFGADGRAPGVDQCGSLVAVLVPPSGGGGGFGGDSVVSMSGGDVELDAALASLPGRLDTRTLVSDTVRSMDGAEKMSPALRAKVRSRLVELENPFRSADGALAVPRDAFAANAALLDRLVARRLRQQEPDCTVGEGSNGFVPRTFVSAHAYFVHFPDDTGVLDEVVPEKGKDETLVMERRYLRPLVSLVSHVFDLAAFVAVLEQASVVAGLGGDIMVLGTAAEHCKMMVDNGIKITRRIMLGCSSLLARCDDFPVENKRLQRWRDGPLETARTIFSAHLQPQLHDGNDSALARMTSLAQRFNAAQGRQDVLLLEGQRHLNQFLNTAASFSRRMEWLTDDDGIGADGRGSTAGTWADGERVQDYADTQRALQATSVGELTAAVRNRSGEAAAAADAAGAGEAAGGEGDSGGDASASSDEEGEEGAPEADQAPPPNDDDLASLHTSSAVFFENQRRFPLLGWKSSARGQTAILYYAPFTDQGGVQPYNETQSLADGWAWRPGSRWAVDYTIGDEEGFVYAFDFPKAVVGHLGGWNRERSALKHNVRRRRYRRPMVELRTWARDVPRPAEQPPAPGPSHFEGARRLVVLEARVSERGGGGGDASFALVTEKVRLFVSLRKEWCFTVGEVMRAVAGEGVPSPGVLRITAERGPDRELVAVTYDSQRDKSQIDFFAATDGERVRAIPRAPFRGLDAPLRVVEAWWGLAHKAADVTEQVQHLVDTHRADRLELCPTLQFSVSELPRHATGVLYIHYEFHGRRLVYYREAPAAVTVDFYAPKE